MSALSDSTTTTASPFPIVSPSYINHDTIFPSVIVDDNAGIIISLISAFTRTRVRAFTAPDALAPGREVDRRVWRAPDAPRRLTRDVSALYDADMASECDKTVLDVLVATWCRARACTASTSAALARVVGFFWITPRTFSKRLII